MPRNSSGIYQLPAGNPVVSGTLIESDWANATMSDVAQALTDSLDRFGRSQMAAPMLLNDGTLAAPGMAFGAETSSGLWRKSAKVLSVSVGGQEVATFAQTGITFPKGITSITGDLNPTGNLNLDGGKFVTGVGTSAGSWKVGPGLSTGGLLLQGVTSGDASIFIDPVPDGGATPGTHASYVRVFQNVNTSGTTALWLYRGDGSTTIDHAFYCAAGAGLMAAIGRNGGRVTIGTATDNGNDNLQVAGTALFKTGASGATADANYGDLVIEGSSNTGISIITPNTVAAGLVFGDPQNSAIGGVTYSHSTDTMTLTVGAATRMQVSGAGARAIGVPFVGDDGSASAPTFSWTTQPTWGMYRIPSFGIGFGVNGNELVRMYSPSNTGPTVLIGGSGSAQNALANRGLLEVNGTNDSVVGLTVGGTKVGFLQAFSSRFTMGTQSAVPLAFYNNGVERARITEAAQSEFLVGTTTVLGGSANRGNISVNGTDANVALGAGGTLVGYLLAQSTRLLLSSGSASVPLVFGLAGVEVARVDTNSTFQYGGVEVGWRDIPQNVRTSVPYTGASADRGKCVRFDTSASGNFLLPSLSAGSVVTVVNNATANTVNVSLVRNANTELWWGTGTGAVNATSRTLAYKGVATLYWFDDGKVIVTGSGLS